MRHLLAALALLSAAPTLAAPPAGSVKEVQIKVTTKGFEPHEVKAKKGQPISLVFTRTTEDTCITAIDVPAENVKEFALPLNKAVTLTLTPKKAGVEKFHCSAMGMGDGKLIVED
ncbi:MAG TPA: cupredoxin domain-containing protein [Anaeromyxobacteraceae bacterium]|nr:cupredoxin domain-containing protein [Anaeromyxobacteraceae bacterium]